MATKKQKREAALAKREAFLEEQKRLGLEAQKRDREERADRAKLMAELAEEMMQKLEAAKRRVRGIAGIVPQVVFVDETRKES